MTFNKALLLTVFLLAFVPAFSSAEPLVKPETATPVEICPSCNEVRVLLVPDDQSKVRLNEGPEVEAAYFNGSAPRDAGKFKTQWIGGAFPREIKVIFDRDETKQAGTYDLYLNLQPGSNPGAERLKIQLIRPAASLEAIPKLIIDRIDWVFGSSASHPELRVTETSKKSGITISGIRPVSNSVIGATPIGGTLKFDHVPPEIKPGDQVPLNYTLDGRFGLGSATGTMKIDAPQLASPVSFDFEVHSHVHWLGIGITILVALLISWLVKVKLQKTIELDQARLDAHKLIERIEREEKRHADPQFSNTYKEELDNLREALKGDNATDINDRKVALDTKWQKALQDFAKSRQEEQDALNKLHDFVTLYDWMVPPKIGEAIMNARAEEAKVGQLINDGDLTKARDERKEITSSSGEQSLGKRIQEAAIEWQTKQQNILGKMRDGPPGIPATIPDLPKTVADLLASLRKVDENTKLDTPEQIYPTLKDIENERLSVKRFADWLSDCLQIVSDKAAAQIPEPPPAGWNASNFDKAPAAVKKLATFLETMVDNPDPPGLENKLGEVHQAWTAALQGQFTTENALVKEHLDARDYVQATTAAVHGMTAVAGMVASAKVSAAEYVMSGFRNPTAAAPLPMSISRTLYQTVTMPDPAVPTSVTDENKLKKDKGIQSLIIGVLLVFAGYGLQLNTFVGTFTDFSTLFFWAFALDLTVDQVAKITKKA